MCIRDSSESNKGSRYYYNKLLEKKNDQNDQSQGAQNIRAMAQAMANGDPVEGNHQSWANMEQITEEEAELLDNNTKEILKEIYNNNPKLAGDIPAHLKQFIEDAIKRKKPTTNWKSLFRRMVTKSMKYYTKSSRRKLNKRIDAVSYTHLTLTTICSV